MGRRVGGQQMIKRALLAAVMVICSAILGAYFVIDVYERRVPELLANQEIQIFERNAEQNYGMMHFWADGETVKAAQEALMAKRQILSNNGWSIIGRTKQEQGVGIITLSAIAFKLP